MPTRHIAVLTQGMDMSKPEGAAVDETRSEGQDETSQSHDSIVKQKDIDEGAKSKDEEVNDQSDQTKSDNGHEVIDDTKHDHINDHMNDHMNGRIELESTNTGENEGQETGGGDAEAGLDELCDSDSASSDCNTGPCVPVIANAVILTDTNSVTYRNQDSPKHDDAESEVHINIQTVPTSRNESNNSPTTGGGESKRNRSSGKSSKKEKPSPFRKKDSLTTKEILNPNSPTPMSTDRCDSSLSTNSGDLCRICQCDKCEIQMDSPLVSPCLCSGSLKFIHQACLQKWIKSSDKLSCELCQYEYNMTKKTKPFREWERLDMTPAERRKVICSVTFHIIAITCVVWSLYVLIDRTTEEVEAGTLLWPFWTKLIVVAIGFTGGVVFMYVQCKMYLTLCKKWRMYNKVIIISSISESQREKANQQSLLRLSEKQAQLEEDRPNLNVFNIVNETDSV